MEKDKLSLLEYFTQCCDEGRIAWVGKKGESIWIETESKATGLILNEGDIIKLRSVQLFNSKFYDKVVGRICTIIDASIDGEKGRAMKDLVKQVLKSEL